MSGEEPGNSVPTKITDAARARTRADGTLSDIRRWGYIGASSKLKTCLEFAVLQQNYTGSAPGVADYTYL